MRRHYILSPFGSVGDVQPFLWISQLLQERGHRVTLVASNVYADSARRASVPFAPAGEPGSYERMIQHPDLWHPWRGMRLMLTHAAQLTEPYWRTICSVHAQAKDEVTLVGPALAFGARIAREKLGVPLVTVHLQPTMLLSIHDTPVVRAHMEWFSRWPRWAKRAFFALPNPLDQHAGPVVRQACALAEVNAPRSFAWEWMHSPDGVVCLFPDWFAAPQPDWPARCHQAGFPRWDLSERDEMPPEVERFLADGPPPVVFTAGTAMMHAREFFTTGLDACRRLGLRAVLATAHREQLPALSSRDGLAISYAPFSVLLPRSAALVHHGGIGTLSHALAAGIPQLLMPMAHDQPDNAQRLVERGVARRLYPKQFTTQNVAQALGALVNDAAVRTRCAELSAKVRFDRPTDAVLAVLEAARFQGRATNAGRQPVPSRRDRSNLGLGTTNLLARLPLAAMVAAALLGLSRAVPFDGPSYGAWTGIILTLLSLAALARPTQWLWLPTRKRALLAFGAGLTLTAGALLWPVSLFRSARPPTRIDQLLPQYQAVEYHEARTRAPLPRVVEAVRQVSLDEMATANLLIRIRSLGSGPIRDDSVPERVPLLDVMLRGGFLELDASDPLDRVYGLVGAPWKNGDLPVLHSAAEFGAFQDPGNVRVAFDFRVADEGGGTVRLSTETRILGNDVAAQQQFQRYWRLVYPGSAIIRRVWLDAIIARAERSPR